MDWKLFLTTALAAGFGAAAGAFALASAGGGIEHQADAKMLEIGVAILREPARVDDDPMRSWAVKVVEKKSGVSFTDQQRAALLKRAAGGRQRGGTIRADYALLHRHCGEPENRLRDDAVQILCFGPGLRRCARNDGVRAGAY